MKHRVRFPEGFKWGAACASYQVEGGIENCDWAEGARNNQVPICGQACDHYNRYESDFDTAQKLGHNSHRLSIEWARIEPEEGKFDLKEAAHYRNVIKSLKARGLEPFVTLWHFTQPLWFVQAGGFENSKSVERFSRYAEFVAKELLADVTFVQTINEPLVWAGNGYINGYWPPFKKRNWLSYFRVLRNLVRSHKAAYKMIKMVRPEIAVSIASHNMYFEGRGTNPINQILAWLHSWIWNRCFLNRISKHMDFIGLNQYFYKPIGKRPELPKSDMGWDIYPESLYHVLIELGRYGKPVYITENGLADHDDSRRKDFIVDYLFQVNRAIKNGVDVRGYFYWSLLDNYEWAHGFDKRFGLIEVNFTTQERAIRPSAFVFKEICESNSLEIDL